MEASIVQILAKIQSSSRIIITSHIRPDGDSLGSMLGLSHYLLSLGKDVTVAIEDDVPRLFQFLPGIQSIVHAKDIHFENNYDLLIVLDTAPEVSRIGEILAAMTIPCINIDHHLSNNRNADYCYIDGQSAATGEIILQLLQIANTKITCEIAVCLYTAIVTDCGFFRYANTSPQTLKQAALLVEHGVKPNIVSENLEKITIDDLTALRDVLSTLELSYNGRIASVTLTKEVLALDISSTDIFINYIRSITGVEIAIMYKEFGNEEIRVSLRSHGADVNQIAHTFGGGGHQRAAGCTISGDLDKIKKQILTAAVIQLKGGQE